MPPKGSKMLVSDLGTVVRHHDDKRRAQMRLGHDVIEYGPDRDDGALAQADLEMMRAGTRESVPQIAADLRAQASAVAAAPEAQQAAEAQAPPQLPAPRIVPTGSGKFRIQAWLGHTCSGPARDTRQEAEADVAKVSIADSKETMRQMIADLKKPVAEPPAPMRRGRVEKRAWQDTLDQKCEDGEFEDSASILSCLAMAQIIFGLFTATDEPRNNPKGCPGLKKCLGQLGFLCYLSACRLGEGIRLKFESLDHDRLSFTFLRYKKFRKDDEADAKLVKTAKGIATAIGNEELGYLKELWKFLELDKGILYTGAQWIGIFGNDQPLRWCDADSASKQFAKQITEEYQDVDGKPARLTGHMFRRTRGYHLLQHELRTEQQLQVMYGHVRITTTMGYVLTDRGIDGMTKVPAAQGVMALLVGMFRQHHAAVAAPASPAATPNEQRPSSSNEMPASTKKQSQPRKGLRQQSSDSSDNLVDERFSFF
jgi:integrase